MHGYLLPILASAVIAAAGQAMTLVQAGKGVATIVVTPAALAAKPVVLSSYALATPEQKVRLAAEELQHYLEQITGARLPIVADTETVAGPVILVGASQRTDALKLAIPGGLTPARREEGFLLWCKGDILVLAGNDRGPYHGTFYAVAEFLHRLGVRWFMPTAYGEVVPRQTTVEIAPCEVTEQPDFVVRCWWNNMSPEMFQQEAIWKLRNKMQVGPADLLAVAGDSSLRAYLPDKALLKTHPEYFGKNLDQSVNEVMVHLVHPEVPKLVADRIKAALKQAKDQTGQVPHSIGIAPDDGLPMDLSKDTMATNLGFTDLVGREGVMTELSVSEEWFRFMNQVAAEVVRDYPDVVLATNGYANRNLPPEGLTLHPNLAVMFAAIWSDTLHAYDDPKSWQAVLQGQLLKRWCQLCPRVTVYNYNETMLVTGLTPVPLTRKLARNFPLMKRWGVLGFNDESNIAYMSHGITTYYVRARLMWRADLDVKATLADYFAQWYGPAAVPAQGFWDALEAALESSPLLGHEDRVLVYVYTPALLARLGQCVAEAEALAVAEPFKTHVRADRLILEHLKGYVAMHAAEFSGNYVGAVQQADAMFKQREQLHAINPFYHVPESKDPRTMYYSGAWYWNLTDRRAYYQKLADLTTGKTGRLVAISPKLVKFRLDDGDLGRLGRWHDPGYDRRDWRLLDTTIPFYLQGYMDENGLPYRGLLWYVFEFSVSRAALEQPIHVFAPVVTDEAWVWTNGGFTGHRPYAESYIRPQTMEFAVTSQLKPGRNVIAVRVSTSLCRTQVAEGFQGPLFLYTPIAPEK